MGRESGLVVVVAVLVEKRDVIGAYAGGGREGRRRGGRLLLLVRGVSLVKWAPVERRQMGEGRKAGSVAD